jgi:hypothetical protein
MKPKRRNRPADADPDDTPDERIFDDDPEDDNLRLDEERLEELFDIGSS